MIRVRQNDMNNDWTFGNGKQNYIQLQDAIKQNIKTRLQQFYGDCFWNTEAGIDYFTLLDKGKQEQLEQAIRITIINTEGIVALNTLSVYRDQYRELHCTYEVKTIYDEEMSGVLNLQG